VARIFPDAGCYARVADATGFPVGPLETVFRLADSLAAVDRVSTAAWRSEVVSLARRPLLVQLQEARKTARGHLERVASLEDAHLRFLRHLDRGHIAGHGHPLPSGCAFSLRIDERREGGHGAPRPPRRGSTAREDKESGRILVFPPAAEPANGRARPDS